MAQASISTDSVRAYLRDIGRIPLLTNEEEITLGRKVQRLMELEDIRKRLTKQYGHEVDDAEVCAHTEDKDWKTTRREFREGRKAKETMVTANLRLVVSVAKKYTKRNMELLDIIQEGTIGLVRGVEKFDPSRGYKFSTYAYWWIRQGITRAIAEKSRAIRLPIHITENLNKLKKAQRDLAQKNGYMPDVFELAKELGLSVEEIKDLLCKGRHPASLEVKVGENHDTSLIDLLEDETQLPDYLLERMFVKEEFEDMLYRLPDIQSAIIEMRYGVGVDSKEPMTMTAIGQTLNMSRDRVRTLENKALQTIKEMAQNIKEYI